MRKSGLTSATLQDLRHRARETAGFEIEIEMEVNGEPEEFKDADSSEGGIAPDLPGEPWDHDWKVNDPVVEKPKDNATRNLEGRKRAYDIRNYYEEHVEPLERPRGPVGIYVEVDLWDLADIEHEDEQLDLDIDHYEKMVEKDLTEALNLGEDHHLVVVAEPLQGKSAIDVRVEGVYPDMADELKNLVRKLVTQSAIDVGKGYGGQGEEILKGGFEPVGPVSEWEFMTEPGVEEEQRAKEMTPGHQDWDEDYWPDEDTSIDEWDEDWRPQKKRMTGVQRDAAMVRKVISEN